MTDKQIIIDGVDVSECEHYEDLNCFAYRDSCGYPLDCKDNPSCYYKQLKHKHQECEKVKQTLIEIKEIAEEDFNHTCRETYARQLKQILQKINEVNNGR